VIYIPYSFPLNLAPGTLNPCKWKKHSTVYLQKLMYFCKIQQWLSSPSTPLLYPTHCCGDWVPVNP